MSNPLQGYPTATAPGTDDWLYLQGTTNDVRKLSPAFYPKAASGAYIIVPTTDDSAANGVALLAAYTAAAALTPNGAALSAANRACVILPPGLYDLVTTALAVANFVDIFGLVGDPKSVTITSRVVASNSGTIVQAGRDTRYGGITIQNTASTRSANDATDACAYCLDDATNYGDRSTYFRVTFDDGAAASWGMRQAVDYSGTFDFCLGSDYAFAAHNGQFRGTARSCTGGTNCFGGSGGNVSENALLQNCVAGDNSFGNAFFDGRAYSCRAGNNSFGGNQFYHHAYAFDCTAGSGSFGGNTYTGGGIARNCIGGELSFGASLLYAGKCYNCAAGNKSFGGNNADIDPAAIVYYPRLELWTDTWAPFSFPGKIIGAEFSPSGSNKNAVTLPDGATGEFEFCTFRKTGSGVPLGLASGSATIKFSYCKFNTVDGVDAGITNALGADLAAAFCIGDTDV